MKTKHSEAIVDKDVLEKIIETTWEEIFEILDLLTAKKNFVECLEKAEEYNCDRI